MAKNDDFLQAQLVDHPEEIFARVRHNFNGKEFVTIIERFELARDKKAVYNAVIDLFRVLKNFFIASEPDSEFAKLRINVANAVANASETLKAMQTGLLAAQKELQAIDSKDQVVLQTAINYVRQAIRFRMQELYPNDPLGVLWEGSLLQKMVE